MAAGGETVGELVARRLGFRYVDEEIVTLAARQAQVDAALVAAAEQRQRVLQRLLEKLPRAHDLAGAITLAPVVPALAGGSSSYRAVPEESSDHQQRQTAGSTAAGGSATGSSATGSSASRASDSGPTLNVESVRQVSPSCSAQ